MYRGQDIGNREKLIRTCLRILQNGTQRQRYGVLPHIRVLHSPAFVAPLLELLQSTEKDQQQLAALALGSLGDPQTVQPLFEAFMNSVNSGAANRSLQTAIIVSLGEIGEGNAVEPLLKIYELSASSGNFVLRRKKLVLIALGNLAQQGCRQAEGKLRQFLREETAGLQAQALSELCVAYWHRPHELSEELCREMLSKIESPAEEVREIALSSLSTLADLGCQGAEGYFSRYPGKIENLGTPFS